LTSSADTNPPADWDIVTQLPITNSTSNPAGKIMQFSGYGIYSNETGNWFPLQTDCSPSSGSNFPIGSTTVTCTATDAAGNVRTETFTVTVILEGSVDTTPPVLTVPSSQTYTTNNATEIGFGGASYDYGFATATDDSGSILISCSPQSGSFFTFGTTTVTCTATDDSLNVGIASFTVTVTSPAVEINITSLGRLSPLTLIGNSTGAEVFLEVPVSTYGSNPTCDVDNWNTFGFDNTSGSDTPGNRGYIWNSNGEIYIEWGLHKFAQPWHVENGHFVADLSSTPEHWGQYGYGHPLMPEGTHTISCSGNDSSGNYNTASFTVTVVDAEAAEEEIVIPSWIKNNAGWWASNQIDDRSFVSGLQWLISNGIMNIPPTEQGAGSDDVIPGWIKNNAGWWADDLIDDRNFVTGLQWLITNGIMVIG
jgi:hypothetical protein